MIEHSITIEHLKDLLNQLHDDDILIVNQVRNLTIVRKNVTIGFIDLLKDFQQINYDDLSRL